MAHGPLAGMKILEFSGLGPGPFCGMLLSDLGADVLRIDRPAGAPTDSDAIDVTRRGRTSLALDLKSPEAIETCRRLAGHADIVIEGFRPGVMERLGLGPDELLRRNPKLVYGRITGWGQDGPYAQMAGHDLNYIAISGALHAIGTAERPVPPLNLVGDFGGGALYLAFGLLAGVIHARTTGAGQVVDCAMSDGAASLLAYFFGALAAGNWRDERRSNLLDGGAPFYDTYQCSDGKWIAVGALESRFYAILSERLGLELPHDFRDDPANWPALSAHIAAAIATRPRDEWSRIFEGSDACVAPVMSLAEAPSHPHNVARGLFRTIDGVTQPGPLPNFSVSPGNIQPGREASSDALAGWGLNDGELEEIWR